MDCKETLENLNLLLDGELNEDVENQVMAHLHDCWHCNEVKDNEVRLKQMIKEKLAYRKTVPAGIIDSIKEVILAAR